MLSTYLHHPPQFSHPSLGIERGVSIFYSQLLPRSIVTARQKYSCFCLITTVFVHFYYYVYNGKSSIDRRLFSPASQLFFHARFATTSLSSSVWQVTNNSLFDIFETETPVEVIRTTADRASKLDLPGTWSRKLVYELVVGFRAVFCVRTART